MIDIALRIRQMIKTVPMGMVFVVLCGKLNEYLLFCY